ncbi:hypothetical protein RI367_001245 [Sorochytrium milnesiophthora]
MLQCHVKNCDNGYPLRFQDVEIQANEQEINTAFLINMLPKLDWDALRRTAISLGLPELPSPQPENIADDPELLQLLHRILMETSVVSGEMVCPSCEHKYPIRDGIPNMLLSETEV